MTLTEQFSNDTKIRNYTRIYDPGHSWLEVPIKDVRDAAGVWDKITAYSPLKRHKFYLEEDCDATAFDRDSTIASMAANLAVPSESSRASGVSFIKSSGCFT